MWIIPAYMWLHCGLKHGLITKIVEEVISFAKELLNTLGPDTCSHFLLQYRGFPISVVENVLITPVVNKIFVLIMEVFSIASSIRRVY